MTASHRHADHEEPGSVAVFAAVVSASRSTTGPVSDPEVPAGRPRLTLPALAPYYYLPVDPVCDVGAAVATGAAGRVPRGRRRPAG